MADLIERQAVMDALWLKYCNRPLDSDRYLIKDIRDTINSLPSAQPYRKTGKWIHDGCNFKGGIDWMHCSECGHQDLWDAATRTPFCGWCGARMQEGEDNE